MKASEVYINAAKKVSNEPNVFTCDAIRANSINFMDMFDFEYYFNDDFYTDKKFFLGPATSENQLARSIALLLMAEIIKENE